MTRLRSTQTTAARLLGLVPAALAALLLIWGPAALAGPDKSWFVDKQGREHPGYRFKFTDKAKVARAIRAQEAQFNKLMRKRGIVGSAIGWDENGEPVIRIFSDGASPADIPAQLDGFAVKVEVSGSVFALKYLCRKDNPNRAKQCPDAEQSQPAAGGGPISTLDRLRPVPNGVSIGHPNVTAGTLACIVNQGCHFLALSNNHVMADSNNGSVGDPILQPGPFDGGSNPQDVVGTLFDWVDIVMSTDAFNRVDGALALVNGPDFTNTTPPDGYGMPKSSWLAPQAGMNVMKYGRTTRYTEGVITGINASVNVNYNTCCARFVGQIVVEALDNPDFALGGDSGALVVLNGGADDRRPVGLIFALAENGDTFANPIDDVVSELNIDKIVGGL
jgi:hypothetical protein